MPKAVSPEVTKRAQQITKLASRKSGVTRADAMERLSLTPAQWYRAVQLARLKQDGKTRNTIYHAEK